MHCARAHTHACTRFCLLVCFACVHTYLLNARRKRSTHAYTCKRKAWIASLLTQTHFATEPLIDSRPLLRNKSAPFSRSSCDSHAFSRSMSRSPCSGGWGGVLHGMEGHDGWCTAPHGLRLPPLALFVVTSQVREHRRLGDSVSGGREPVQPLPFTSPPPNRIGPHLHKPPYTHTLTPPPTSSSMPTLVTRASCW